MAPRKLVACCNRPELLEPVPTQQYIAASAIDGLTICGRVKIWLAVKNY